MLFDDVVSQTDISIPQEVGIDVGISRVEKDKALSASCLWVSEAEEFSRSVRLARLYKCGSIRPIWRSRGLKETEGCKVFRN
jgi:hypothetical protein